MAQCHPLQQVHQQQVVVVGQVGLLEYRGHFELVGRYLVVTCGHRYAQFVGLAFKLLHESHHAGRDAAEVVVVKLLAFRRSSTEEGTAGLAQVWTGVVQRLVYEEILLLPSQGGHHLGDILVEILAHFRSGLVHCREGLEQRCFVVEGLSGVCDKDGGDAQRLTDQKRRAARIPQRVSTGFECGTDAAIREARSIGLLLNQKAAVKPLNGTSPAVGLNEAVVLFGGAASQRLEPVGVVGCTTCHGPLFQSTGHLVGNFAVNAGSVHHGRDHMFIRFLCQVLAHGAERKGQVTVVLGDLGGRRIHRLRSAFEDVLDGSNAES